MLDLICKGSGRSKTIIYESHERRPIFIVPRRQNIFIDRLAVFGLGTTFSALLTLFSSLFLLKYVNSHGVVHDDRSIYSAASSHPIGRTSFLARIFLDQENKLKGEMLFLAAVIEGRLKNHPDPHKLALQIVTESFIADYDPIFVAAVINAESTFKHQAVSNKGASGLMQLMPDTARYISQQQNVVWRGSRELHEPTYNLRLGIAYLKYLERKFKGNREKALIAYNWGPGNLEVALRNNSGVPSATIKYARGILANHRKWKEGLTVALAETKNLRLVG